VIEPIQCQYRLRSRGLRRWEQCCRKAKHNVAVYNNPDQKPLAASNYDTTKMTHDVFVCGIHLNVMARQFRNYPADVWHMKATPLRVRGA
jgi:hypothetical protein